MNLLLLDPSEADADGRAVLTERRAEHLLRVLGVEPGQSVRAGLVDGPIGTAEILETTKRSVTLRFRERLVESGGEAETEKGEVALEGEVDLVVGLPRPQVLHRVLQTCSAMSVRRLDLVNAWRVEKSFFQSPSLSDEKIRYQLLLGAEQGMSTRLPEVRRQKLLVPFLRSVLSEDSVSSEDSVEGPVKESVEGETLRLIAHPDADVDLEEAVWQAAAPAGRPVQIAIGPEGGWIDREIESFGEAGFRPVRLGSWILRVEVAVAVALGQLAVARRRTSRRAPERSP